MAESNGIILFHYPKSPVARQVVWYLTLLGVPYAECIQPQWLPRPDLQPLNISYRRIPVMAIGRDIYCDSRIILRTISQLFPSKTLLPQTPEHIFIQRLVEKWSQQTVFGQAASLMPVDTPAMQNARFRKDREQMTGRSFDIAKYSKGYPESRVNIREAFDMLEGILRNDDRQFLLGTTSPTLVDIQAIFPFQWLATDPDMRSALPQDYISERQFPRVYAWIHRFEAALAAAQTQTRPPILLSGSQALERISSADLRDDTQGSIDEHDPLGLKGGELVDVYPIDTGFRNKDRGHLITLAPDEVAVKKRMEAGEKDIVIHMPRAGFRIVPVVIGKL